jgi:hypothetical protein
MPSYLQHADMGIIPFDVRNHRELIDAVNPLKVYEYLAAGLPVVATDWLELSLLNLPIHRCRTPEEFVAGILSEHKSPTDKGALENCARRFDWSYCFKGLGDLIAEISEVKRPV